MLPEWLKGVMNTNSVCITSSALFLCTCVFLLLWRWFPFPLSASPTWDEPRQDNQQGDLHNHKRHHPVAKQMDIIHHVRASKPASTAAHHMAPPPRLAFCDSQSVVMGMDGNFGCHIRPESRKLIINSTLPFLSLLSRCPVFSLVGKVTVLLRADE